MNFPNIEKRDFVIACVLFMIGTIPLGYLWVKNIWGDAGLNSIAVGFLAVFLFLSGGFFGMAINLSQKSILDENKFTPLNSIPREPLQRKKKPFRNPFAKQEPHSEVLWDENQDHVDLETYND